MDPVLSSCPLVQCCGEEKVGQEAFALVYEKPAAFSYLKL
jgi:hypothetical protein